MNVKNFMRLVFQSLPENVSFARSCVGAFASQLDCNLDDIEEIKLVVSEAVSNCIIHGYDNKLDQEVEINVYLQDDRTLEIIIKDWGKGIADVQQALEPAYSSDPSRMGLGFTFMKSFMDELEVLSTPHEGTSIRLRRCFTAKDDEAFA